MLPTAYIDGGPLENEATEFTTQEWVIVRFELRRSCECGGRDKRSLDLPHIRPTRHREIEWIFYDRRKLKWICLYVRSKFTWSFKLPNMKSINWLPDFIYGPYFFETPRSLQYSKQFGWFRHQSHLLRWPASSSLFGVCRSPLIFLVRFCSICLQWLSFRFVLVWCLPPISHFAGDSKKIKCGNEMAIVKHEQRKRSDKSPLWGNQWQADWEKNRYILASVFFIVHYV